VQWEQRRSLQQIMQMKKSRKPRNSPVEIQN
jgi:hypothetical protein